MQRRPGSVGRGRDVEERGLDIAEQLGASARRLPEKTAVAYLDQEISYGELDARADRAAAGFQRLGLRRGDRVALMLANTPHFLEAFYGALRAGLVVVPLNTGFTANEVAHILGDSGARVVVVSEAFAATLVGVREALPSLSATIVAGPTAPPLGAQTWRQLTDGPGAPEPVDLAEDDLALLQYTSGTTGRPKGAMLTHGNLLANHEQMLGTRLRVEESDVVLAVLPLFHIYALNVAMAFPIARGATILLLERFDPVATLEQVVRRRATVLLGAPPMYTAWVNLPDLEGYDLASVRYAVSGAAALPRSVLGRFVEATGVPVWEGYGLTETAPVLTSAAMGDGEPIGGSVGRPLPGVELRLVDDRGDPVRRGDPGEVVVRGPNVFRGYWQDATATAAVLDDEGWFRTGDVGYAEDGNLFLVDRKKDLVIVSGFNVYPREVEEVLYRHPKIAEAAVIGIPHPYTGEAVKAVVVLRPGEEATAEEITDFARRHLARFKCPEVVEFAPALPHLPSGKVRRRDLRGRP